MFNRGDETILDLGIEKRTSFQGCNVFREVTWREGGVGE